MSKYMSRLLGVWRPRKNESFQPIAETDTTMSSSIPCGHHIVIVIGGWLLFLEPCRSKEHAKHQIMGHELMVLKTIRIPHDNPQIISKSSGFSSLSKIKNSSVGGILLGYSNFCWFCGRTIYPSGVKSLDQFPNDKI